jgi:hypothetical protein
VKLHSNRITGISSLLNHKGSIPECIGLLKQLWSLTLSDNRMNGTVPESIGQLVLLQKLHLGYETNSNMFLGPLPSSMSKLIMLKEIYLNVATLTGPLVDFSRATLLVDCAFQPSQMCIIPEFVSEDSECDFSVLPECETNPDCEILKEWLPNMFDVYTCCQEDGVNCEKDRVVILDLSKTEGVKHIDGFIPMSIGGLDKLEQLYLQGNFLEGNLPLSMSNIQTLQILDISNNFLSGVLPFAPLFELIGIESNWDLSLPFAPTIITKSPTESPNPSHYTSINESEIAGISVGLLLIVLFAVAVGILLKRRKQGKESKIELMLLQSKQTDSINGKD